jgi:hypothetical protein
MAKLAAEPKAKPRKIETGLGNSDYTFKPHDIGKFATPATGAKTML